MAHWNGHERRNDRRDQYPRLARGDEGTSFEVGSSFLNMKIKGMRVFEILFLLGAFGILGCLVFLAMESRAHQAQAEAHTRALEEVARTQRFFACVISIPMERRIEELQKGHYCAEIAHYNFPKKGER